MPIPHDEMDDVLEQVRDGLAALTTRVAALESAPGGGSRLADEAMLDLNERLASRLNATEDDAARAAIIRAAFDALA